MQAALGRAQDTSGKPASVLKIVPSIGSQARAIRSSRCATRDTAASTEARPKFARSPKLELLLADYRLNGTADSLQAVGETLNAIAFGGIHDHLGGGMHRYSVDTTWSVPHLEKMLYLTMPSSSGSTPITSRSPVSRSRVRWPPIWPVILPDA